MQNERKVIIISGPSGVGKSTICAELLKRMNVFLSVSTTTRQQGKNEVDGKDYHFISKDEFEERIGERKFLEYAEVFGNYYGTPREPIEQALAEGKSVILEIDVQGAMQVKQVYPDAILIFILPPTQADLNGRIDGRARGEDDKTKRTRLDQAGSEIAAAWQYYDNMVIIP